MPRHCVAVNSSLTHAGNVTLSVDLDLAQIGVTPTAVITGPDFEADAGSAAAPAASEENGESECSVRHFVRLTAYTGFDSSSRRWNAQEIVLFRDKLYGGVVPLSRKPPPLENVLLAMRDEAAAVTAGATASRSRGTGTPATSTTALPSPMTAPFSISLFGLGAGGAGAAPSDAGGAAAPSAVPSLARTSSQFGSTKSPSSSQAAVDGVADAEAGTPVAASGGAGAARLDLASFLTRAVRVDGGDEDDEEEGEYMGEGGAVAYEGTAEQGIA